MATKKTHTGFKKVASKITKQLEKKGEAPKAAKKSAGAILAAKSRGASTTAKKKNPSFKKVPSKMKK